MALPYRLTDQQLLQGAMETMRQAEAVLKLDDAYVQYFEDLGAEDVQQGVLTPAARFEQAVNYATAHRLVQLLDNTHYLAEFNEMEHEVVHGANEDTTHLVILKPEGSEPEQAVDLSNISIGDLDL